MGNSLKIQDFFWTVGNFLKLAVMKVVHEYSKNDYNMCFKWVNYKYVNCTTKNILKKQKTKQDLRPPSDK